MQEFEDKFFDDSHMGLIEDMAPMQIERREGLMDSFKESMERMRQEMLGLEDQMLDKNLAVEEEGKDDDHKFSTQVKHRQWQVVDDGHTVKYAANQHSSVMGEKALFDEGINTFSVAIDEDHSLITLGVATRLHRLDTQVGSDAKSWGFNLSTGHLVHNGDTGVSYGR